MTPEHIAMLMGPEDRQVLTRLGLVERHYARYGRDETPTTQAPIEVADRLAGLRVVRICYGHPKTRVVKFTPLGRQVLAVIRQEHAEAVQAALVCLDLNRNDLRDLLQSGCL